MTVLKCKMCGGDLEAPQEARIGECVYCGTRQTLPNLDSDKKASLYDRANHFRRSNDFDKAAGIYELLLNEDPTDAEAYWSLVLCRYGIEYVEDPASHRRIPTVNRAQYTSVFDDENYRAALRYASPEQQTIYEHEARAINDIQKGILEVSGKEEPFDVFICYKETDNRGQRTVDSVLAQDLYQQLTREGLKVFFARITLEDKLGSAYEPYIFAALNSAKVMIVLGTRAEHFNSVWVKNEWSRYLALIHSGEKKVLVPAYRDMDPYDMPEEFSHLQSQDMGKLGFMQDLIRGIRKIVDADAPKPTPPAAANIGRTGISALLTRAFLFLEDKSWREAATYCDRVLDQEPENARAYFGKLLAENQCENSAALSSLPLDLSSSANYKKALRYADANLHAELESCYIKAKDALFRLNQKSEQDHRAALQVRFQSAADGLSTLQARTRSLRIIVVFAMGFVCSIITMMLIRGSTDGPDVTALIFAIAATIILIPIWRCSEKARKNQAAQLRILEAELTGKADNVDSDTPKKAFAFWM